MKTVRLLLAALSLATLAACGTESITGPGAPDARRSVTPADPGTSTTQTTCQGTVVVTTDASGNTITTCTTETRGGPVVGSGS
jgi:predicted small lipoprotein YifL